MIDPVRVWPEAGPGWLVPAEKEAVPGGTMVSPTLNRLHELVEERA